MVAKRVEFLTGYQDAAYAGALQGLRRQGARGRGAAGQDASSTEAVARYLFKLMAYKDEYEVARLHTDPAFLDKIAAQFEGDYKLDYHLAPPLIAKKQRQGRAGQAALRPVDAARPSACWPSSRACAARALDVFGRTEERKTERALIGEYRACIDELLRDADRRPTCRWRSRSRASRKRSAATAT